MEVNWHFFYFIKSDKNLAALQRKMQNQIYDIPKMFISGVDITD